MGQRGSKALTVLFLLIIAVITGALFLNYQDLARRTLIDNRQALGSFAQADMLDEATVVAGFESALDESKVAEGERLEDKYGYSFQDTRQQQNLQRFLFRMVLILSISGLLLLVIWWISRKQQKTLESNLLLLSERFEEEKRRNAVLLERRKSEEENVKAVITDITHQLKTPIASLKMSLEIAGSDSFSIEERQQFFMQGSNQIDKLDLMLDSMAKLSQLEAELISIEPTAFSLKELVTQVVSSLIMKALNKDIEIEVDIEADHLIIADRKWTTEAVSNILENAIKYSPKRTAVTVRGTILPSYALIEVMDEGPGIPKEEVNLIYRRFYRGKNATVLENEGSGVGLYLARKIIEEQGGIIMMKDCQPQGANFQLTIPLALNINTTVIKS
ncbi:sensor histidine kinase [Enterococcus sp. BWR-S5]|uniref:sensor histidine kinase n=1 Tax=Enterococcus sp. BWR-S5 TaxID=2787714 RepID=UPI001923A622|nr:HAMP domain-containing sensor histidine kinase [Enterococcus sp. BWR-S5]MBL1226344.1 HAMP domain-containing histidine kinase [Enterococcus sp. BWR-S5]